MDGFEALLADTMRRWPFLAPPTARRLVRAYGTKTRILMGNAATIADLGRVIGADLTEAEIHYLAAHEWAMRAEDIAWRRSKLGLRLSSAEIAAIDAVLQGKTVAQPA
jgi:glycerol-3-phosphate dehydrogenase